MKGGVEDLFYRARSWEMPVEGELPAKIREPFKNILADFARLGGGGYPPFLLSFLEHNDCPLRGGGGYPLNGQNPLQRF